MSPTMEMLQQIFNICIIPLLGILTTYAVQWVRAQSKHIQEETDNELAQKYIAMLEDTISNCVIATNQTYVEALKEQGAFGSVEQKIAFEKTYTAVMRILADDAKDYLAEAIGDIQEYITALIEAQVNMNK